MSGRKENGVHRTSRRVTGEGLSPQKPKRKKKMATMTSPLVEQEDSSSSSGEEDEEEEGSDTNSSGTDISDNGGAFASSATVPLDDDSSSSSVNLDTAMNPFSSRLPTKPDKIVMSTLPIGVKVSSVKKSNYTESLTRLNEGIASLKGSLKSENDRYRDFHDSMIRVCNDGKRMVDKLLKKATTLETGLKKIKKQLSDAEVKLKKVTTEKEAAIAAKETLQLKYDIIVSQNKKTEKEYEELKGEMKDMKKEARRGVPSQQQPENSLQQLVTKEQIKLQAYNTKKEIDRKDKMKADKQKQKHKQDNVNTIANMQSGFGFTMPKSSKVSMACNSLFSTFYHMETNIIIQRLIIQREEDQEEK